MKRLLTRSINFSDLEMIANLYAGPNAEIHVFDPKGKVNWHSINDSQEESKSLGKRILFNFGGNLIRFKEFELGYFDCIVDFSRKIKSDLFKKEALNIIHAPSGTLRYIYQSNNRRLHFLAFMQTPTLRSKLIKFSLKGLLRLKQIKFVGKRLHVLSQSKPHFQETLKDFKYSNYSIFLGTPGFWRKPVIQLQQNEEVTHYVKFAVSKQTELLINNERRNNLILNAHQLQMINLPEITHKENKPYLAQRVFQVSKPKRIHKLNESIFLSLKELSIASMKVQKIEETSFYSEILDQLHYLKNQSSGEFTKMCHQLNQLKSTLKSNQHASSSIAHGDLTPWNVYQKKSSFYIYDWEMSIADAPTFYDVFHFIYQSELLVCRNGLPGVEKQLHLFFKRPMVADFVKRFRIDLDLHHHLYLLHAISKNLVLISEQSNISTDQNILIENWRLALNALPLVLSENSARASFLDDLELYLKNKSYAALKFYLPNFKSLPIESDLDLVIDDRELIGIEEFISKHLLVRRHVKIKKTFMSTSQIHFEDGSYLSADFIHDFIRKGHRYLDSKAVLSHAHMQNNVKRPALFHDIEYAQHFYTLNNADIPLKYQHIFEDFLTKYNQKEMYLTSLKTKCKLDFNELSEAFEFSKIKKKRIKEYTSVKHNFSGFVLLQKRMSYLLDLLVDLKHNKGFMVTFSGVDGAGKTTIIKAVKTQFEQKYRKEIVLKRHRPGLLPILSAIKHGGVKKAEQKASQTLPRQGKNKSEIGSYIRFSYYFTDYLIGQVYIYFKYILRGKIVIYDRYYFDFINDAKRSNIKVKRGFSKGLFKFIYKPDFNFYLYNDPEVILARKQELKASDINNLNLKYAALFNEFERKNKGSYVQIKNDVQSETITEIFHTINNVA